MQDGPPLAAMLSRAALRGKFNEAKESDATDESFRPNWEAMYKTIEMLVEAGASIAKAAVRFPRVFFKCMLQVFLFLPFVVQQASVARLGKLEQTLPEKLFRTLKRVGFSLDEKDEVKLCFPTLAVHHRPIRVQFRSTALLHAATKGNYGTTAALLKAGASPTTVSGLL